jgi:hypothetical protein
MEIKKGGIFKKKLISFIKLHETSYQLKIRTRIAIAKQ